MSLASFPRLRAVEVDDVDPAGPCLRKAAGDDRRVVGVDLFALEVALTEAHDAPVAEVDRREDLEG